MAAFGGGSWLAASGVRADLVGEVGAHSYTDYVRVDRGDWAAESGVVPFVGGRANVAYQGSAKAAGLIGAFVYFRGDPGRLGGAELGAGLRPGLDLAP